MKYKFNGDLDATGFQKNGVALEIFQELDLVVTGTTTTVQDFLDAINSNPIKAVFYRIKCNQHIGGDMNVEHDFVIFHKRTHGNNGTDEEYLNLSTLKSGQLGSTNATSLLYQVIDGFND